jgi:hypothetical protein
MLKVRISSLDEVAEKFKSFYTVDGDEFVLDEDLQPEDTSGLKKTNKQLKDEKLALKTKADALQALIDASEEAGLEDKQEYEKLLDIKSKQFDVKFESMNTRAEKAEAALQAQMITSIVNEVGSTLAGENSVLIKPHLENRFAVDMADGTPKIQILDKDGTPGIITKEQLIEEFKTNETFKPILKGRNSSGGGSNGGSGGSGGENTKSFEKYFDPEGSEYNTEKQYELQQSDKVLHDKLVKKFKLDDPYAM